MNHQQVTLQDPDGKPVDIDAGIAELIGYLWKLGIKTAMSCENSHGEVWVLVCSREDAERYYFAATRQSLNLRPLVEEAERLRNIQMNGKEGFPYLYLHILHKQSCWAFEVMPSAEISCTFDRNNLPLFTMRARALVELSARARPLITDP